METAIENGNYKTNNKYARKLNALNKKYKSESFYIRSLKKLMKNNNYKVASIASADLIRNNTCIFEAIQTLEKISKMEDIGLVSLSAKLALERWNDEGSLE